MDVHGTFQCKFLMSPTCTYIFNSVLQDLFYCMFFILFQVSFSYHLIVGTFNHEDDTSKPKTGVTDGI